MRVEEFKVLLQARLDSIVDTLYKKQDEYASDHDVLFNFKTAARIRNRLPQEALFDMAVKHLVAVIDLVDGKLQATDRAINEHLGDMINYLILLEATLKDRS